MKICSTFCLVIIYLCVPALVSAESISQTSGAIEAFSISDVQQVQVLLNTHKQTRVAEHGPGSPGYETNYFGPKTTNALKRFQELHRDTILTPLGLTHGTGILGSYTQRELARLNETRKQLLVEVVVPKLDAHEHGAVGMPDLPHSNWFARPEVLVAPEDMWVTSIVPYVSGAEREILHHMTLYRINEVNPICPNTQSLARELFSASINSSEEAVFFPEPYALFIKKGDSLAIEVMTHNPGEPIGPGGNFTDAHIGFRLVGISASASPPQMRPVEFIRLKLDDKPCASPPQVVAFTIASNTPEFTKTDKFLGTATSSASYTFPVDGTIIGLGANFWPMKGGKSVHLIHNNKLIAELTAEQFNPNIPWAWRIPLHQDFQKEVHAHDTVSMDAVYENTHSYPIKDAVGFLGFYFAPNISTTTTSE